MHIIGKFFRWCKKVFEYAIFLWDDEDWDFAYILKMLKYRIERTRKCIVANNIVDYSKIELEMLHVEALLDKMIKDEYGYNDTEGPLKLRLVKEMTARKKDYKECFRYLSGHIQNWWD